MRSRWILALGLAAVGLIWTGQGLGLLGGSSFMVGDGRWAIAGVAVLTGAVVVGLTALRGRRQA